MFNYKVRINKLILAYRFDGLPGINSFIKKVVLRRLKLIRHSSSEIFIYSFIHNQINNKNIIKNNKKIKTSKSSELNWILTDFLPGSGGHMTIFRLIEYLEKRNIKNNIYLFGSLWENDPEIIKNRINKYFVPLKSKVIIGCNHQMEGDAVIATSWPTVYPALLTNPELKKIYFVQDFEPYFYPRSSEYIFAENTYKKNLYHICASYWLADKLRKEYRAKSSYFNLGYDEKFYYPNQFSTQNTEEKTVIFYGRWVTPRRGYEMGILALKEVYERIPGIKIKIFGWSEKRTDIPFPYEHLGILSPEQLGSLYRSSTIGLSISLTNISLIPVEMMACKLPVVEVNHPSVVSDFKNNIEILSSEPDPHEIAENLIKGLTDQKLRDKIAQNSYRLIRRKYNWPKSFEKIEKLIRSEIE